MSGVAYLVHDSAGKILRRGVCPESLIALQAGEGETAIAYEGEICDTTHTVQNGKLVAHEKAALEYSHAQLRGPKYPPAGDQLGALWRWIETLPAETLTDEMKAILGRIAAVKSQYPKDPSR